MAKLTVYFKYKAIDSYLFENRVVHIGRDETNDIKIDSLAVAPAHAAIVIKDKCLIKQLNDDYPLIINGQKTKESILNNNDTITVGKHDIVFNDSDPLTNQSEDTLDFKDNMPVANATAEHHDEQIPAASLQVMSGDNIGKVVSLKRAMTRLGNIGSGILVITKRKDGYFVSALENNGTLLINSKPLNESYLKLQQNDVLSINNTTLQFFLH
jgi:pSer/pThr/pTyr-binding forkhead associated (FHA) protein